MSCCSGGGGDSYTAMIAAATMIRLSLNHSGYILLYRRTVGILSSRCRNDMGIKIKYAVIHMVVGVIHNDSAPVWSSAIIRAAHDTAQDNAQGDHRDQRK